jgi:hypothetical protein
MDDTMDTRDDRNRRLPEHEDDSDVAGTSGGGIMSEGGTTIDRGTGTTSGTAQGVDEDAPDDRDDAGALGTAEATIAYGAATKGTLPNAPGVGTLPEAGLVPDQDEDERRD